MDSSHTPGPWFPATGWVGAGTLENPRVICSVHGYPYGNTEANVQLIAAAPELLKELTRTRDLLAAIIRTKGKDWLGYPSVERLIADANAAIAKAVARA